MSKPELIGEYAENVLQTASESDLECLVRGIKRDAIIDLVKRNQHLQQTVFHGFRATHLPWDRVPSKLARDARALEQRRFLLGLWLIFNKEICEHVSQDIHIETLEDDIAKLLATTSSIDPDRLYWALLLDEREEIQRGLKTQHLLQALLNPTSDLRIRVGFMQQLEAAKLEIASLHERIEGLESENDSATQKIAKLEKQRVDLLQEQAFLQIQNNEMQQRAERLHEQISSLQEANKLLQAEIDQLQSLSQNQDQKSEEETCLKLLKLKNEVEIAYTKRDEERKHGADLEAQVAKLKYDKETLIHQKRVVQSQLEQTKKQLWEAQQVGQANGSQAQQQSLRLDSVELQTRKSASTEMGRFDALWLEAVETLKYRFSLEEGTSSQVPSPVLDRWSDWRHWQYIEQLLVRPLLDSPFPLSQDKLSELDRAQKLLVLRWYLLEWMRMNSFERLNSQVL
jgi:hypothetical protein